MGQCPKGCPLGQGGQQQQEGTLLTSGSEPWPPDPAAVLTRRICAAGGKTFIEQAVTAPFGKWGKGYTGEEPYIFCQGQLVPSRACFRKPTQDLHISKVMYASQHLPGKPSALKVGEMATCSVLLSWGGWASLRDQGLAG